jgi:hypothetical protein
VDVENLGRGERGHGEHGCEEQKSHAATISFSER